MSRTLRAGVIATAVAITSLLGAATATATTPEAVTIHGVFTNGTPVGSFTATAPLCPAGDTLDVAGVAGGLQGSSSRLQLVVAKQFTCASRDSFTLLLQVHLRFDPAYANRFTWTVIDGTGAFERLHGTGSGTAVQTNTGGLDTYTGEIHFD